MLFELLGLMEYYHPRMQLRLQLARIMILNLLNLYSLIWALFGKIDGMAERLKEIKNVTSPEPTYLPPNVDLDLTMKPPLLPKLPTSTIQSITESVFSKISEIINYTTEYPTEPTESYDYYNTNYFEYEERETKSSTAFETTTTTTFDPLLNFTDFTDPFYIDNDFENATNFYSNTTGDLFENFNMSNLISFAAFNSSGSAFNLTQIEPIASAFQGLQYNLQQQEHMPFINMDLLNASTKIELRKLCWETMFGQELVKLTVMDLVSIKITAQSCQIQLFFPFAAPNSYANNDSRLLSRPFRSLHELVLVLGFGETLPKGTMNQA